jgi:hypothetical protein
MKYSRNLKISVFVVSLSISQKRPEKWVKKSSPKKFERARP